MSARVVGVPTEIKDNENRVAVQPDGVAELVHAGHQVIVQAGAGLGYGSATASSPPREPGSPLTRTRSSPPRT